MVQPSNSLPTDSAPPEPDPPSQAIDFLKTLWQLDEGLERLSRHMLGTIGVTGPQRMVLRLIGNQPGISAQELARTLHLHPSTVSGIVKRLESEGFLRRLPHPEDGRSRVLELTQAGSLVVQKDEGTVEAAVEQLLNRADPNQVAASRAVLQTLTTCLQQERIRSSSGNAKD